MPRRKRRSKRRVLSPAEQFRAILEEGMPPNPLVRRGPEESGEPLLDEVDLNEAERFDPDDEAHDGPP